MITSWMLYALMVGGLVVLAALAGEHLLRLAGRPGRAAWVMALVAALALPLLTALRPPEAASAIPAGTSAPAELSAPSAVAGLPAIPAIPSLDRPLAVVWVAASLALLAVLLYGIGVLAGRRGEWREETVDGRPVLVAEDVGPAVVGWRRMQVVLPRWALGWDAEARGLILAHEEEHIRRGDPRLLLAGLLAALLAPWNLALWYAYRRLRLAIELDCDARVLGAGADARRYGEVLLAAGARTRQGRLPALATFAERTTQLERRIAALGPRPIRHRLRQGVGAVAVAGAALLAACTMENPLGLDLTSSEQRALIQERHPSGVTDGARIRALATALVASHDPGAIARGGVPEETVVILVLDARDQVVSQSIAAVTAMRSTTSALAGIGGDQIASIEVLKGRVIGLENVGVIVARLRDAADLPEKRHLSEVEEVATVLLRRAPVLYQGDAAGNIVETPAQIHFPSRTPLLEKELAPSRRVLHEVELAPAAKIPPGPVPPA